jgi:hypothetical protein
MGRPKGWGSDLTTRAVMRSLGRPRATRSAIGFPFESRSRDL